MVWLLNLVEFKVNFGRQTVICNMFMHLFSIAVPRDVLDIQEPEKYVALLLHVCVCYFVG